MKIKSLLFCNSSYFYHRLIMASGCKWDALPMIHLQRHAKNFQKNWLQSVYGNFAYIFVPRGSSGPISQQVNIRYYLCNKVSKQVGWRTTLLFMMDLRHCHFSWGRINFDIQSLPEIFFWSTSTQQYILIYISFGCMYWKVLYFNI